MSRTARGNGWCRHRTPFDVERYPVCEIGVDYNAFRDAATFQGTGSTMPCLGENAAAIARCARFSAWTAAEIERDERALADRFDRYRRTIRPAIIELAAGGNPIGAVPCPGCGTGTLQYSVARNGHVHCSCSTPGCATWME